MKHVYGYGFQEPEPTESYGHGNNIGFQEAVDKSYWGGLRRAVLGRRVLWGGLRRTVPRCWRHSARNSAAQPREKGGREGVWRVPKRLAKMDVRSAAPFAGAGRERCAAQLVDTAAPGWLDPQEHSQAAGTAEPWLRRSGRGAA